MACLEFELTYFEYRAHYFYYFTKETSPIYILFTAGIKNKPNDKDIITIIFTCIHLELFTSATTSKTICFVWFLFIVISPNLRGLFNANAILIELQCYHLTRWLFCFMAYQPVSGHLTPN